MKPLVIYHADCTDGFGAAFAAWLKFGDEAEYLPMHYGDTSPDIMADKCRNREVYILDFSFSLQVMDHIFAAAKRVVWLDHHKTAFEMWCGKYEKGTWFLNEPSTHYISLDDNKSGALLAWEYFHPDTEVPLLIQHIDDRDRWQFKLEGSKELHAALASYKPWSFALWKELNHQLQNWNAIAGPHYIFNEGAAILRAETAAVKQIAKQAKKCFLQHGFFNGGGSCTEGLAVNSPIHQSEIGHELATQSGTFGLVWYVGADNCAKCSLRSNGDCDVSAIAKAFGGGGHKNAAGFETDIDTLMGWLK